MPCRELLGRQLVGTVIKAITVDMGINPQGCGHTVEDNQSASRLRKGFAQEATSKLNLKGERKFLQREPLG